MAARCKCCRMAGQLWHTFRTGLVFFGRPSKWWVQNTQSWPAKCRVDLLSPCPIFENHFCLGKSSAWWCHSSYRQSWEIFLHDQKLVAILEFWNCFFYRLVCNFCQIDQGALSITYRLPWCFQNVLWPASWKEFGTSGKSIASLRRMYQQRKVHVRRLRREDWLGRCPLAHPHQVNSYALQIYLPMLT